MNTIQNQAQISYISSGTTNTVRTPDVNTSIVDPNIRVVKSCCVPSAERGSIIRYTISVINSGDIATDDNVVITDYVDKAGTHVGTTSEVWRNNIKLSRVPYLQQLTRETFYTQFDFDNTPAITVTTLLPGDVIIITYSIQIDIGTPLINNELHNTATASFELNGKTIVSRSDICTVNINYSKLLANKRGRAQGHAMSNLFYALELTNEGTSEASNIIITEDFPSTFQPNSGFGNVKKDIAIVNFIRHANTIENIITKTEKEKVTTTSLYDSLNANYYRLKAHLQDVLAKIAELSTMTIQQQQESMNTTAVTLMPDLNNSQTLALDAFNRLFTKDPNLDPGYSCIFESIETLFTAVEGAKDTATTTPLPDSKDIRASLVCDAHDGALTLLDLCDLTNDATTMAAVVNRYIVSIAVYLQRQFKTLGMDTMLIYKDNYDAITLILDTARTNLTKCTQNKDIIVATTADSELLMTDIMNLAFSETERIKELEVDYSVSVDETQNIMTLNMNGIHIKPKTLVNNVPLNGHMDIYLNGHIDMEKF